MRVMRGMLLLEEQMKEKRHSVGSCLFFWLGRCYMVVGLLMWMSGRIRVGISINQPTNHPTNPPPT